MKELKVLIAVACALIVSGCSRSVGEFIDAPGVYRLSVRNGLIEIFDRGDFVSFRIVFRTGGSIEPDIYILKEDTWFVYPETDEKVWVYDGVGALRFFERTTEAINIYQLSKGWNSLPEAPPLEVIYRLPKEMKDEIETSFQV